MLKKTFILVLTVAMLLSSVAMAEITNRDQQLLGGVAVSNANDTFFFAPMEEGATKHWGLYALSSWLDGHAHRRNHQRVPGAPGACR